MSRRTETAYKADAAGKVAQHTEAQGSPVEVNAEVVQLQFAFLPARSATALQAGSPLCVNLSTP